MYFYTYVFLSWNICISCIFFSCIFIHMYSFHGVCTCYLRALACCRLFPIILRVIVELMSVFDQRLRVIDLHPTAQRNPFCVLFGSNFNSTEQQHRSYLITVMNYHSIRRPCKLELALQAQRTHTAQCSVMWKGPEAPNCS
jgi:hypothetical protein